MKRDVTHGGHSRWKVARVRPGRVDVLVVCCVEFCLCSVALEQVVRNLHIHVGIKLIYILRV